MIGKPPQNPLFFDIGRGIILGLLVCYGFYCLAVTDSGIVFRYVGY
jgi:hypothetical protein